MSDLISRKKLIDTIAPMVGIFEDDGFYINYERVLKIIIDSPSIEPKVGRWFDHSDEGYVQCPFCGSLTTCEDNIDELHYCFNCGAKMERRADEKQIQSNIVQSV